VQTAGDSVGFIIRQGGAVLGDSFEVDNLVMNDVDSTAPTAPTGLTAKGVSSSEIDLVWQASTDTDYAGVWGYRVYRDGGTAPIATLNGAATGPEHVGHIAARQWDDPDRLPDRAVAHGRDGRGHHV
jgi:hypothetical protein